MTALIPVIDYPACIACGVCVQACPFSCFELTITGIDPLNKTYPHLSAPERCTGCAICQKACPVDVILMQEKSAETIQTLSRC